MSSFFLFLAWLLLLNVMFLTFIHDIAYISGGFFIAKQYFII